MTHILRPGKEGEGAAGGKMNEHDRKLAAELEAQARATEARATFAGYWELEYRGESYWLDDTGIDLLAEDVLSGDREASDEEKREALKAQGYTLE